MVRAVGTELGLEATLEAVEVDGPPLESDGLDWPLRLAVLWQRVAGNPIRRTQQGEFFKRDVDRLENDPLLNAPSAEGLPAVPDAAFLAVGFAVEAGLLDENDGELKAGDFPPSWDAGLPGTLAELFQALAHLKPWSPLDGWKPVSLAGNPFPSAGLLALLLLGQLPAEQWTTPQTILDEVLGRHPYWASEDTRPSRRRDWVSPYLLGLAYQLRLVQAARHGDDWAVRLSPAGRWMLGLASTPPAGHAFPKTLLVQPNLEVVAYRQGLTPSLVAFLARVASWQSLGAVCMLQLGPDSVYRGLEGGLTFERIQQTLEKHGTIPTPPGVVDSLRTWSNKRDRITVYPSGALLEFASAEDLEAAFARGFSGVKLSDRLAVVPGEEGLNYSLFRLTSSRDYASRPEQCVDVGEDGVTLTVDLTRSDLLLESELSRFAEPIDRPGADGKRRYRLTPATLANAREAGFNVQTLEMWFQQRAGSMLPPAVLLLLTGSEEPPPSVRREVVLHLASEQLADGLLQWPPTRALIAARLGPTTLSVEEANVAALRKQLAEAGIGLEEA
jgi:hypothetical protein